MSSHMEPLVTALPVRRGRFSRPRRRWGADRRGYVEASAVTAPPATSVLAAIAAIFPVNDVIAGATARAASQSTIHPLDTVKVRMQAALKGNNPAPAKAPAVISAAAPSAAPVSGGKYGIGIGQAVTARSPRSMVGLYELNPVDPQLESTRFQPLML